MKYENAFIKLYEETLRKHFELPALSDYGSEVIYT
jgi:hypothetical protein